VSTPQQTSVPHEREPHTIILRGWRRAIELAELTLSTRIVRFVQMPSAAHAQATPIQGFAVNERGYIKAVYAVMGQLYLQIAERRWRVDQPNVKIIFKRLSKKKNRVKIEVTGEIVFSEDYPSALSDPVNAADPTFDAMDEESEDFWLWASRSLADADQRRDAATFWSGGSRAALRNYPKT